MDTQVGDSPTTEGEWAVECILSHARSRMDSVFEIKRKLGDVTWLPYYQITHLQALMDYLDLLGESDIQKLPKGTSKPPLEDPQLFAGSLSFLPHPIPLLPASIIEHYKRNTATQLPLPEILTFINPILPQHYHQSTPTLGYVRQTPMPQSHQLALLPTLRLLVLPPLAIS